MAPQQLQDVLQVGAGLGDVLLREECRISECRAAVAWAGSRCKMYCRWALVCVTAIGAVEIACEECGVSCRGMGRRQLEEGSRVMAVGAAVGADGGRSRGVASTST